MVNIISNKNFAAFSFWFHLVNKRIQALTDFLSFYIQKGNLSTDLAESVTRNLDFYQLRVQGCG